ncbi:MAG: Rrf2 family transcriptional regulator [Solirubrobacteraceae bacterium]
MISKRCKYAIKAMIFIAKNQEKRENIFSSTIALEESIPKKFLESILRDLKNGQLLKSRRGPKGGYLLNKTPEEITLTHIIRLMDGPIAMLPCASFNYHESCADCFDEATCEIKKVFEKIRDTALGIYNQTTLAGFIQK